MPRDTRADVTAANAGIRKRVSWRVERCACSWSGSFVADARRLPRVSAVIACYKDAQAIPLMYERLSAVFTALAVDYEIIFVNDGSPDDTAFGVEGTDGEGRPRAGHRALEKLWLAERLPERDGARHR